MLRMLLAALVAAAAVAGSAVNAAAQASPADGWRPPAAQMPTMPSAAELRGDWASTHGVWFQNVERISGVPLGRLRAQGEPPGEERTRFVRFNTGPLPVVRWSDRNGDGRADLIEIYREGTMVLQIIDADYDGRPNAARYHDRAGALVREERL